MIKAYNLKINHMENPIGIEVNDLLLTWNLEGEDEISYQVVIDGVYDSKKINSSDMSHKLPRLEYKTKYEVKLTVYGKESSDTETTFFETGINIKDIQAKWINPELVTEKDYKNQRASYLKKEFELKDISNVKAYATAHGIFTMKLNGENVTDRVLMPGTTQVNKRLMLETLDLSKYAKAGKNVLEVTLGNGWYRGAMGNDRTHNNFGTDIAFLCQIEENKNAVCITDKTWLAANDGPIGLNDMMEGEVVDARLVPNYHEVKEMNVKKDNLINTDTVPVRQQEAFNAKLITTPANEKLLDFGVNLVGYVHFDINAKEGSHLKLSFGETLDENGNFTMKNFVKPRSTNVYQVVDYICKEGMNSYNPTMCYFGFRYVKVEADFEINPDNFKALSIYSDMKQTSFFKCSDEDVNKLFINAVRSMKGNFVDVPTDCPTREKSGYSGDCQAYINTAMYLMDCYPVYHKWYLEQKATQGKDGKVAQVAPQGFVLSFLNKMANGGVGWCDSFTIVPYELAKRYNDDSIIKENYEAIKKWQMFCVKRAKKPVRRCNLSLVDKEHKPYFVDRGFLWGEWLEPNCDTVNYMKNLMLKGDPEVAIAYLSYTSGLVSEMAAAINNKEDEEFFHNYSLKARETYDYAFIKDGKVDSPRQCRYVRPIGLNMVDEETKYEIAKELAEKVKENNNHLNTGFLTTNMLNRVLSDYGQTETSYDLLLQKTFPSFLYSVTKGATSILESWTGIDENNVPHDSHNHYSYGAICGWLMDSCLGIRLNHGKITIAPKVSKKLSFAEGTYDSPVGRIAVSWKYENDKCNIEISIPSTNKATIILPNNEKYEVTSGTYKYSV